MCVYLSMCLFQAEEGIGVLVRSRGLGNVYKRQKLHTGLDCSSIRDLWKLRYRGAAVEGRGTGWAGEEFRPSDRQQILLQAYRTEEYPHWQGPYFGKDALRLLRDMQDPEWVRMYRDGG